MFPEHGPEGHDQLNVTLPWSVRAAETIGRNYATTEDASERTLDARGQRLTVATDTFRRAAALCGTGPHAGSREAPTARAQR